MSLGRSSASLDHDVRAGCTSVVHRNDMVEIGAKPVKWAGSISLPDGRVYVIDETVTVITEVIQEENR